MFKEEEKQMAVIRKFARAACEIAQPGSPLQMLRSKESHNPTMDHDVKNGQAVNKELLDEAITLLFAGQDTSAATLSWTLHLLSLYPNVQRRLAKEVREDLASMGHSCNEGITKRMISKMSYLDAVIKEAMRLYPVAPFVVRRLPDDLSIPAPNSHDEKIIIPKDTFACIWIYGLHRNKKLWHRPDDFVPERWLDPEIQKLDDAQTKYKGTFMPFAAGPRNCVGQPLAQVILRIILARIMNECEIIDTRMRQQCENTAEEDMIDQSLRLRKDMQAGFTVLPSGGVKLLVHGISKKSR
jgi:cytochrome P450